MNMSFETQQLYMDGLISALNFIGWAIIVNALPAWFNLGRGK